MPIYIFEYQASSSAQSIANFLGRMAISGASPSRGATPWASSQGIMRSLES